MKPSKATAVVVRHHLSAIQRGDIPALLGDYHNASIILTPSGPVTGISDIRCLFEKFLGAMPAGSLASLTIEREDIVGNVAYVLWRLGEIFPLGTDTLVIQDGKISVQSYAVYSPSEF